MTTIDRATKLLNVAAKDLESFNITDPFNDTRLRGFICRVADHRYGALYITHVDDFEAEQLIYAVPKFHYPFDKNGVYHFPKAHKLEAYEKLDGTSIAGFVYKGGGKSFVTYKTRLTPTVRASKFGDFLSLWREILVKYPEIPDAVRAWNGHCLAFELWGRRNKHLILYQQDIEASLLFGINKDIQVIPPSALGINLPCPQPEVRTANNLHDLVGLYRSMQEEMDASLVADNELAGFRGAEGKMWYFLGDTWLPFKCKPATIENIHWAAGGISQGVIKATAYNVLETDDELTVDGVVALLKEEFNDYEIGVSATLIAKTVHAIQEEMVFRRKLEDLYDQAKYATGQTIESDHGVIMRWLSDHFPKSQMRHVFAALKG